MGLLFGGYIHIMDSSETTGGDRMKHKVKLTVLDKKLYPEL